MTDEEMNRFVAENIYGAEVKEMPCRYDYDLSEYHPDHKGGDRLLPCYRIGDQGWRILPDYSTEPNDALPVYEMLSDKGLLGCIIRGTSFIAYIESGYAIAYQIQYRKSVGDCWQYQSGRTLPQAICLAALNAVAVELKR